MADDLTSERGSHHGFEFDRTHVSLQARWAVQMGQTIFAGLPAPDEPRPFGAVVQREGNTTTVSTQHHELQETSIDGATVSGVTVTLDFIDGELNGAIVRFLRPRLGKQGLFLERKCVASTAGGFPEVMSLLPEVAQTHITRGMMTLAERFGIPHESLRPAEHLQAESDELTTAQQIMAKLDRQLLEGDTSAEAA